MNISQIIVYDYCQKQLHFVFMLMSTHTEFMEIMQNGELIKNACIINVQQAICYLVFQFYSIVYKKRVNLQFYFLLIKYIITKITEKMMQNLMPSVRNQIWSKLACFFDNYQNEDGQMSTSGLEKFIVEVLGEKSPEERAYVMNNLFRVDLDNNGSVSFFQLGRFLFMEHCCEISLQRHHKMGKMSYGHLKKMTFNEYVYLINQAYKFLSVSVSEARCRKMFNEMDKDRDNLITYQEYFSILNINASTQELPPEIKAHNEPVKHHELREIQSKLRQYMWERMKKLFDSHVKGRSLPTNETKMRALVSIIVKDFNLADIDYLLYYLGMLESNIIKFEPLASKFIEAAAQLGLKKFMKNHLQTKKNLNKHEFARLLKESLRFMNLGRFKDSILYKIFERIDKNNDGWITYKEYMDWAKRFLAMVCLDSSEFLASQDDVNSGKVMALEMEMDHNPKRKIIVFSNYSLAKKVRNRVRQMILTHIKQQNRLIYRKQLENVIPRMINKKPEELKYFVNGVFRQDEGNKGAVTLQEFVNFMIQLYYGESAIQVLHAKDNYMQGANRKMSRAEFKKTIELMLSHINIKPSQPLLDMLFYEIDTDKTRYISYREYFTFNLFYFGKQSLAAYNVLDVSNKMPCLSEDQYFVWTYRNMSSYARFKAMMIKQMKEKFNNYGCNNISTFQSDKVGQILQYAFKMTDVEVEHVYRKFFHYMVERGKMADLEEVIQLIIASYFELHLSHRQTARSFHPQKEILIDFFQFWQMIIEMCHFVPIKPVCQDLLFIFNDTDVNKDGKISWQQCMDFAKNIFMMRDIYNEHLSQTKQTSNSHTSDYESKFIQQIEQSLKKMFDRHKTKGKEMMNKQDMSQLCKQMKIFSNSQIKFIVWSLFEAELNLHKPQKEVDFQQFSSFVLNYIGQLSLEKFQAYQQEPNKNQLVYAQFYLIIYNAFSPFVKMQKYRDTVSRISRRIGKGDSLPYSKYMNWVHESFAMTPSKKMVD